MSATGTIISESDQSAETLARWTWCGVIIGFLGLQIVISGVAVFLATSDPSNVIVEGYYERALSWDEQRQSQADSDALGWSSRIKLGKETGILSNRNLQIRLQDRADQPIKSCQVEGELYHHARASDVFKIHFKETNPGLYETVIPMKRSGQWELSLIATHTKGTFQERKQILIKDSGKVEVRSTESSSGRVNNNVESN